jgi:hypothetical protein
MKRLSVKKPGNWELCPFSESPLMIRPFWMPSGGPFPEVGRRDEHDVGPKGSTRFHKGKNQIKRRQV